MNIVQTSGLCPHCEVELRGTGPGYPPHTPGDAACVAILKRQREDWKRSCWTPIAAVNALDQARKAMEEQRVRLEASRSKVLRTLEDVDSDLHRTIAAARRS